MLSKKTPKKSKEQVKTKIKNTSADIKERVSKFFKRKERSRPGSFSIAFQISIEQIASRAAGGLLSDLLYLILIFAAVFYNTVMTTVGSFNALDDAAFRFEGGDTFMEYLSSAVFIVSSAGKTVSVNVGSYARFMFVSLVFIMTIQFIVIVALCVVIPSKTYEKLKPLYNITEAAQALKNIDIASESDGDMEIHTGKEELAGLEDAVNDLLKRSRASYKSQIRFVSDASHELRTPIAVIRGYADMLERWGSKDQEILEESISSIKSEAENMSRLVENLLFLARGDSGRAVIRFEETDIDEIITDIYDEFTMIDKTHNFRLDVRDDVMACADPSLIKQCLRILTDNAIKYSPEGTDIILRLRQRDPDHYALEVQDRGIGIKKDEADKIFERFFRSDPARNRSSGGYGLGLSIAKWIADKHSGFFEVLSYENLGTRISLILPYKQKALESE